MLELLDDGWTVGVSHAVPSYLIAGVRGEAGR
jgi:hypothetical protein